MHTFNSELTKPMSVDSGGTNTPFGRPGGARRIEHVAARRFVGDALAGSPDHGRFIGRVAVDRAVEHQAASHLRHLVAQQRGLVGQGVGGDEQARAAIVDDVGRLAGRQAAADRGIDDARALRGPADLEVARVVLQHQRDAVAGAQAGSPEEVRQAVRAGLQLTVADRLRRRRPSDRPSCRADVRACIDGCMDSPALRSAQCKTDAALRPQRCGGAQTRPRAKLEY